LLITPCLPAAPALCYVACCQTNNPRKLDVLTQLGVKITGRIPCQVQAGQYNEVSRGPAVRCWGLSRDA